MVGSHDLGRLLLTPILLGLRKIDMLNIDLALQREHQSRNSYKKKALAEDSDDAAFHFAAYMPIKNKVWKLDGLSRQPQCLGMALDFASTVTNTTNSP